MHLRPRARHGLGINGGLPSMPYERNGSNDNEWLSSVFSEGRHSDAVVRRDGDDARVVNHYPED
jgi:hypothetical protein